MYTRESPQVYFTKAVLFKNEDASKKNSMKV